MTTTMREKPARISSVLANFENTISKNNECGVTSKMYMNNVIGKEQQQEQHAASGSSSSSHKRTTMAVHRVSRRSSIGGANGFPHSDHLPDINEKAPDGFSKAPCVISFDGVEEAGSVFDNSFVVGAGNSKTFGDEDFPECDEDSFNAETFDFDEDEDFDKNNNASMSSFVDPQRASTTSGAGAVQGGRPTLGSRRRSQRSLRDPTTVGGRRRATGNPRQRPGGATATRRSSVGHPMDNMEGSQQHPGDDGFVIAWQAGDDDDVSVFTARTGVAPLHRDNSMRSIGFDNGGHSSDMDDASHAAMSITSVEQQNRRSSAATSGGAAGSRIARRGSMGRDRLSQGNDAPISTAATRMNLANIRQEFEKNQSGCDLINVANRRSSTSGSSSGGGGSALANRLARASSKGTTVGGDDISVVSRQSAIRSSNPRRCPSSRKPSSGAGGRSGASVVSVDK